MTLHASIAQGLRLFGLWILFLCILWDFLEAVRPHARSVPGQDDTYIVIPVQIVLRTHNPLVSVVQDSTRVRLHRRCGSYSVQCNTGPTYRICCNSRYYTGVQRVEQIEVYTYFIYKINFKKSVYLPLNSRNF